MSSAEELARALLAQHRDLARRIRAARSPSKVMLLMALERLQDDLSVLAEILASQGERPR